jgi:Rod binding domain-containing protein
MKIAPSKIATALAAEPINRSKEAGALKPLAASDFAGQLQALIDPASANDSSAPVERKSSLRPLTPIEMIPGIKGAPALKPLDTSRNGLSPAATLLPLEETQYQHATSRAPKTEHDKIQEQARKWVAQTFYGAMLKQMRESPFKSEMFSGGRGGQAFATMLDQHLADHMSRAAGSKLVNAIARKLEARAGYVKQQTSAPLHGDTASPNTMRMPHVATGLRA